MKFSALRTAAISCVYNKYVPSYVMTLKFNPESDSSNKFAKLGMWYILALSVIILVAIAGQTLIQRHLHSQVSDSRVVNLAGTQRYKSQWIVKMSLLLYHDMDHKHFPDKIATLRKLLGEWRRGHEGLQHGDAGLNLPGHNSEKVTEMFRDLDPLFNEIYKSANTIIEYKEGKINDSTEIQRAIQSILDNEAIFLGKMDQIVYQYDYEAKSKVATLSRLEYILLIVSIIVIVLEILFVFRPTTVQVNKTMNQLIASEKNAKKLSKEIGALYASLEKSYEDLSYVNLPPENPKLYAKTDRGGNVIFVADLYYELTGKKEKIASMPLIELFPGAQLDEEWMEEVIEHLSDGNIWQGVIRYTGLQNKIHWADILIVPSYNEDNEVEEWLVLGSDITLQKQAEQNMTEKNKAAIEKKINQQKFRSVLILEGQEEERKRLAMDIHDGIGQMLTSLKFQIESIEPSKPADEMRTKLFEIQQLINQVIKEVRRVTFNLKPTVLSDYGLQAALNVFVKEIAKLSDMELTYTSDADSSLRLPQKIENNVFRIIQEAINNAIKYSEASRIDVSLRQSDNFILISVKDNGKGFDEKLVEKRSVNIESGRGFFNMYERTEYINGSLDVKSEPGKGTTITLTVPVKTLVTADQ
jgi:two-component system, NarL family, sensor histidine kinase DegS